MGGVVSGEYRNAAIFYEVDGFTTQGKRLLGRQSAGESFLKGFVKSSDVEKFYCFTDQSAKYQIFKDQIAGYRGGPLASDWISPLSLHRMSQAGTIFYSGPGLEAFGWQRRYFGDNNYSLCGLTHTTCSQEAMQAFGGLLTGPIEEWDAVICTSQSVKTTMEHVLGNYAEHLASRGGGTFDIRVQLPILPLGINCEDFEAVDTTNQYVQNFKAQHGIAESDIVVLYVGRLASHAKAHPLPMYQALEKAAGKTDKKIHLVQAGWFAAEAIETQFKAGAAKFCPSVNAIFVDGREAATRKHIWHVGDIFTTLADNIQETFGITPLEAMAAGLPVVATDWDGYRETVCDGETGFLVRTTMPEPGAGVPLAYRYQVGYDHYDRYIGQVSLFTNVDTDHCAAAYLKLIEDPDLRQKMGAAGRRRVNELYDWQVLIPQYQDLWASLADRRMAAAAPKTKVAVPLFDDPFAAYAHYPTSLMGAETRLELVPGATGKVGYYLKDALGRGTAHLMPAEEVLEAMLTDLSEFGVLTIGELAKRHNLKAARMTLFAGWLAKMDLVKVL